MHMMINNTQIVNSILSSEQFCSNITQAEEERKRDFLAERLDFTEKAKFHPTVFDPLGKNNSVQYFSYLMVQN